LEEEDDDEEQMHEVEEHMNTATRSKNGMEGDEQSRAQERQVDGDNGQGEEEEDEDEEGEGMVVDEEERKRVLETQAASRDEELWPDEVEVPLDTPARVRFARYRGLKSLRTSPWDPKENLPLDYARIFHFENIRRAQDRAIRASAAGVKAGTYVTLHIANFPAARLDEVDVRGAGARAVVIGGLLQHENKTTVLNFVIQKHPSYTLPVKNKDIVEIHCGNRRFTSSVLLSEHTQRSDKHKMERFLNPSRFTVASIYGPVTYPPAPAAFFKLAPDGTRQLVATGTLLSVDPDRIVLKKIVLCGHPIKVHKSRAVIRYMFHNSEDVRWFKPVQIWTKYGRTGHIREHLGTHGYMKCQFDAMIRTDDTVCMSLYKRVYPKWNQPS